MAAQSEPVRIAREPVVRVTEVVGWFSDVGPHESSVLMADDVGEIRFADVMPETEGKRGRFVVTVEWTEET